MSKESNTWEPIGNTIVNYAINKTSEPVIGFLLRNDDNCVTKVTAYVGRYEPTGVDILYGIELTYKDGKRSIRVGTRGESSKSLSLGHGEKISHMVIRATDRVDGLEVKTNRDQHSTVGGSGGEHHEQNTGNGLLLGFHGTYKYGQLWSMGGIFQRSSEDISEDDV
ncbi:hypothetical protein F9C07_145 [Aspergillus flavus]|uniref:Jacalin-type lectin domain-containing protein n=3 Tax=Aspergillus subgen. Circumdati TaxID=2720871 RepID=B8MW15_ASPFN|nr:uncharacterized protein G4B84_001940 [Aspergillus flavus NRRL3357]KAB8248572.1 hypothetical protein BDV35DRAFT_390830 [Aspergillus flavus]OOO13526.1 Jacalin-related lectin [Aspergillus oryzae]KAF7627521.1 hypothetical protein AFLA_002901 [Aspergillus flavus NRRL3357]KAJ1706268.1 hypothetical protein NYO67_11587 [Aspergillus flavus]QMW26695.1 hypothetical protein G4B84_001940 [Aspergillus flavus NRRL3357]